MTKKWERFLQNCGNKIIKNIAENIKKEQEKTGNKIPTLNNIHDVLLGEFPKIKDKSKEVREIITQKLKKSSDERSKGTRMKIEDLVFYILKDIAEMF